MKDLILSSLSLPEMINERKELLIVIDLDSYNDENADSLTAILIKWKVLPYNSSNYYRKEKSQKTRIFTN